MPNLTRQRLTHYYNTRASLPFAVGPDIHKQENFPVKRCSSKHHCPARLKQTTLNQTTPSLAGLLCRDSPSTHLQLQSQSHQNTDATALHTSALSCQSTCFSNLLPKPHKQLAQTTIFFQTTLNPRRSPSPEISSDDLLGLVESSISLA